MSDITAAASQTTDGQRADGQTPSPVAEPAETTDAPETDVAETDVADPADPAVAEAAPQPDGSSGRDQAPGRAAQTLAWLADRDRLARTALFLACFGAVFATLLLRNQQFLHHAYREDGDFAVNSLSVDRAEHFRQLVGNYSRVGFHHPGPAYFYLLAAGQWLFYSVLHVVPGPFNGQMMMVFAMTAWFVAMTASLLARATRSIVAGAAAAATVFAVAAPVSAFGHMWFPYLYMPMFGLLVVSAAVLVSGRLLALPSYVIAGGFLIHGHVSFLSTVGLTTVVTVLAGWLPRRGRLRQALRRHRPGLALSAVWVVLFALPMVLELALHYPGPWVQYWNYSQSSKAHSLGKSADFFNWYWHRMDVSWWLFALAAAVGAALVLTERRRERRTVVLSLYAVAALESAIFFFYVVKGVDALVPVNHYVGFYYLMVPTLVLATVAGHAASRLGQLRWVGAPVALLAAIGLFLYAAPNSNVIDTQQGPHPDYLDAAKAIESIAGRDGRPVALEGRAWPKLAAVVVQSHRIGDDVCVGQRVANWSKLFESGDLCHSYQGTFGLELVLNSDLGARPALWSDATLSLVAYGTN